MTAPVIEVAQAGHVYRLPRHDASSLKELAIRMVKRGTRSEALQALSGVSFSVDRGQVLGVIGRNGAGKSTLIKLLARVLPPSSGRVVIRGSVSPLIELGAGFHPEQTARENIILYGTIMGRRATAMRARCQAIAEWADVQEFLDVPIRAFSSGMLARLAFSVATDVDPDVLLLDEILSVGDDVFQRRSKDRIDSLIGRGCAVVMVTHNMAEVRSRADRALWLEHGRLSGLGRPDEVVDSYLASSAGSGGDPEG